MEKMTVNAALSMKNSLSARLSELKGMKSEASRRTVSEYGTGDNHRKETVEPTYDIKFVDKKCAELTTALFLLDKAIKQANATVKIDIDVNYTELMKPIE